MVNDLLLENMPQSTTTHISFAGSDYCSLLFETVQRQETVIGYFKFFNCWVDNYIFLDTVKASWSRPIARNPIWYFHLKLKSVSNTLINWSKDEFSDIFSTIIEFEEKLQIMEHDILNDKTGQNRTELNYV